MLFTNGTFIKIDRTRCLNYLHHGVGCTHCISNCPGQALEVRQRSVSLNGEACFGCGLCLSDCPTQVFTASQWDETSVVTEVLRQGAEVTQFFCEYHDHPFLSKAEKDKGAIQIPTCLSSLSKGAWYEIGLHTNVEIRVDKCAECPMNECLGRLKVTVNTAIEWLEASGHTTEFVLLKTVDKVEKKRKFMAVSTGMKTTSRRDLFLSLFTQGKEVITKVREENHTAMERKKKRLERSLLPAWQMRLGHTYTDHFQEGGSPAYWPSIHKSASCVNCGVCTTNCPTKALKVEIIDQKAVHSFNSGQCIDCRMCMLFCPTSSITRDRTVNESPFVEEILLDFPVLDCKRCGKLAVDNGKGLCYWCENEASDAEMISDVWKHFMG